MNSWQTSVPLWCRNVIALGGTLTLHRGRATPRILPPRNCHCMTGAGQLPPPRLGAAGTHTVGWQVQSPDCSAAHGRHVCGLL